MLKRFGVLLLLALGSWTHGSSSNQNVLTHLYNAQRTGWNSAEIILNTTNVASVNFGAIATNVSLDGRIDTQPLIVQGLFIGGAFHDVVYVGTNNDTLYALDATTAAVITSASLGTAVGGVVPCSNDNTIVGILSTPVIDIASHTIYVMAFVEISSTPTYQLHALDLVTLADKTTPATVSAAVTLNDGTTVYNFNASVSRQRAALLLANGNIYAAFASFCDLHMATSRGWLLAWQSGTLSPVTPSQLLNSLATDPVGNSVFLTSIWMSGAGPAADTAGNVYAVTSNSDSSGSPGTGTTSFNPPTNIQESIVKFNSSVSTLIDYFADSSLITLDVQDKDLGSGGVLLLPDQPGSVTHMAVASGKAGPVYLVNRDNMGQWNNGGAPNVLSTFGGGSAHCYCAPAYFMGSDGTPRVVIPSTAVNGPAIVPINTTTDAFGTPVNTPTMGATGQGAGTPFSTVSSNGTQAGSQILWTVRRPNSSHVTALFAFDAIAGTQLFTATAGQWTNLGGLQNAVPVVSNGKVYVATDQQLYIFGLSP